jgi:hypothetical protein
MNSFWILIEDCVVRYFILNRLNLLLNLLVGGLYPRIGKEISLRDSSERYESLLLLFAFFFSYSSCYPFERVLPNKKKKKNA